MLLALLLAASAPQSHSILLRDPCGPAERAAAEARGEVLVCGDATATSQRLPLPDERVPTGPVASNPHLTGAAALAAEGTPCAAALRGCTVGFGPPIAPIVGALVGLVRDAAARKPDKRGRVPIDISEPPAR